MTKEALSTDEQRLVAHSEEMVVHYNKARHARGGIDTLYSFVLSDSGMIHDGACFEPAMAHATICGERHAIANMVLQESYAAKIKIILVADPVPELQASSRPPCGTCRHLIWSHGVPDTTVILLQYIQGKTGWTFPKVKSKNTRLPISIHIHTRRLRDSGITASPNSSLLLGSL